jgi:hypothetical protein
MTDKEILDFATKAGLDAMKYKSMIPEKEFEVLKRFAKLIRNDYSNKHAQLWIKRIDDAVKDEREACAKVCDDIDFDDWQHRGWDQGTYDCAQAIRARGKE